MNQLLAIAFLISSLNAFSQTPEQSLWWNNTSIFNPAFTGLSYNQDFTVSGRIVNPSLASNIGNLSALYDMQLGSTDKFKTGLGLNYIFNDQSSIRTNNLRLNIAEHIHFSEHHSLSAGIGLGLETIYYALEWVAVDPVDPSLPESFTREGKFRWNAGVICRLKGFTIGVAATNLNESTIGENPFYRSSTTYSGQITYEVKVSEQLILNPRVNILTYDDFSLLQTNITALFQDQFLLGVSYSDNLKLGVNAGYVLNNRLYTNYAFQRSYGKLSFVRGNTHEISLAYRLKK
ncbi:MAG: PorP/SprF family type IX secretion system membrane protein [Flavobacteriales bacterium]